VELCPLLFEPKLLPKLWGGRRLAMLGKRLPEQAGIGESWELFDDATGSSVVAVGPHQGRSLRDLSEAWGEALVGPGHAAWSARFPLLIKYLDAREDLSVQVHPDDRLALALEGPGALGKDELWVVLDRGSEARLVSGFRRPMDRAAVESALDTGGLGDCLNAVEVFEGDTVDIPAGRVHALGAGCLVAEVQQNSDLTYRLWDYGRLDQGRARTLHRAQALQALRYDEPFVSSSGILRAGSADAEPGLEQTLNQGAHFEVRRLRLHGEKRLVPGAFPRVLMALQGALRLAWGAGQGMMVPMGGTVLAPAALDLRVAAQSDENLLLLIEPR
jgi:mannose-6-phosphate isomerase class I